MSFGGLAAVSYAVLWLVVVIQTLVIFEVLRQIGILRRRMPPEPGALLTGEGLPRGTSVPTFIGQELRTGAAFGDQQLRGQPALLTFLSPGCVGCHAFAPEVRQFAQDHGHDVQVVVVCPESAAECLNFAKQYALDLPILLDEDQQICRTFQVQRTPGATLVDADGFVRIHGTANTISQLEGLLQEEGTPMAGRQWAADKATQTKEVASSPAQ